MIYGGTQDKDSCERRQRHYDELNELYPRLIVLSLNSIRLRRTGQVKMGEERTSLRILMSQLSCIRKEDGGYAIYAAMFGI